MGPLSFYEIISENTNFLLAFIIGIGFGFVLENSGFSTSRKLAGMFYGYDATVLKVFFTAAITGALGMILFGLFGWLDLSVVFVNPTFLWSAIVGGVVMGAGFIMGGFCPGTSVCGAAIGKIDAMVFVGGMFIGVLIFMEGYPLIEKLYLSGNMGAPFVYDSLGISRGLFALLLIIIALVAFWGAEWAEKKFSREEY
jgi:hypothetical protein